jgi:Protein of unknown function (DUF1153)
MLGGSLCRRTDLNGKSSAGFHGGRTVSFPLTRWDARKKARVVIAVRSGTLSRGEAYDRYMLSEEELSQWEEAFDREGIAGLQINYKSRSDRRARGRTDEIAPAVPVWAQEGPSRASVSGRPKRRFLTHAS